MHKVHLGLSDAFRLCKQVRAGGARHRDPYAPDKELAATSLNGGAVKGCAESILVLEGARAGEMLPCVAATFGALRSVVSHVECGDARHLPEGGYAFENVSRLQSRLVLIPNGQVRLARAALLVLPWHACLEALGIRRWIARLPRAATDGGSSSEQVDGAGKASAAQKAGAMAVILQVPDGLPPPDPGLAIHQGLNLAIPVVFCDTDLSAQLQGSLARLQIGPEQDSSMTGGSGSAAAAAGSYPR